MTVAFPPELLVSEAESVGKRPFHRRHVIRLERLHFTDTSSIVDDHVVDLAKSGNNHGTQPEPHRERLQCRAILGGAPVKAHAETKAMHSAYKVYLWSVYRSVKYLNGFALQSSSGPNRSLTPAKGKHYTGEPLAR